MRLFVAVNLPTRVREQLHRASAPLRAVDVPVKWIQPDGFHITLKFLGDVPPARERSIVDALDAIGSTTRTFSLMLGGFGAFPRADRPRIVWCGCEASAPLELLQHEVERGMAPLGFPVEGRPFRPHVTVGRTKKGAERAAASLAGAFEDVAFDAHVDVATVDLMESTLTKGGARYTRRHAAAFAP